MKRPNSPPATAAAGDPLQLGRLARRIVATRELPPRPARTRPFPDSLPGPLAQALRERGIEELYTHQRELYERAQAGEDVVITTSTASGKTLSFLLPVLQAVHEDPAARVILLYPTKALAHDQLRGIVEVADGLRAGEAGFELGVYDGDTSPEERRRLRERANLVLTNPDMLNAGLVPAHGRPGYSHLFRNVRYVVIDEMHVYRGAFGAHFSNLMRRLLRVCRHYGSEPQFLCSSATIANPQELAEKLCHRRFALVDDDGSPSPGKVIHFWQPPKEPDQSRRPVDKELAQVLPELVRQRKKTIAFCRGRKQTEVVLKEARDHLKSVDGGHDESQLLAAYRGGYTKEERRRVEQDLIQGRLLGVVSTNALELGIDVGPLEVVLQAGFPGTRASFWQQLGRAGRRGKQAHGVLILAARPTDRFIASDPDWLVRREAEHAVVDADNLSVQLAHVRAAAAELPLTLDDVAWFPDLGEALPVLEEAGELRETYGSWHWTGSPFPAGDFSLRDSDGDRFKIVDRASGVTLTEMTRPQVYREAHTRAIYLHGGQEYLVEELDLVGHRAVVVPVEQNFYTQPDVRTHIEVLVTQERRALKRSEAWFGDVRVDDTVVGYKMLEFHNHQNLGYETLHQELSTRLDTEALWLSVPDEVLEVFGERKRDALKGMVHALRAVARIKTMAERSDLLGTTFPFHFSEGAAGEGRSRTVLALYDHHSGGLGFAARAFEHIEALVGEALQLVASCDCGDGCPACVGSDHISRELIAWGLENLLREVPPPAGLSQATPLQRSAPAPAPEREVAPLDLPAEELPARWPEAREHLLATREPGAGA
ncbi:MAG TPA: DEAD/DEAH box helicase, partial [Planctomycetes bacterium]|nr:DEAD/DEAH box helicase [Planctomycetota bacterium]